MRGIDISNWQKGLDVSKTNAEFVIAKCTQGTSFVDPCCYGFITAAQKLGRLTGVYHYVNGKEAEAEMRHFTEQAKSYIGNSILCLDWEPQQNAAWQNKDYLGQCIEILKQQTGKTIFVYSSLSYFPWQLCNDKGCRTWVAQYANSKSTSWQGSPWNENAYKCDIRQYTSTGRVDGWGEILDLDKAYITAGEWQRLASGDSEDAQPTKSVTQLALETVKGMHGNGNARKAALGSRYSEVQAKINSAYRMTNQVIKGKYGNGSKRKKALGEDYELVQFIVNQILK